MVSIPEIMQSGRRCVRWVLPVFIAFSVIGGCATDVIPTAPTPRTRELSLERSTPADQLLKEYSTDFEATFGRESAWKTHMLVYLTVRFLALDGLKHYRELSETEKEQYPGIRRFVREVESYHGQPWSYAAYLSLETLNSPGTRESFRSDINYQPFQNFAVGKWLKLRLQSDQPLPDFNARAVNEEIRRPILTACTLILAAQYYLQSYQTITEPTALDDHYQADIQWLLKQWRQNYLRIRTIWPRRFDLSVLSSQTLSPLYEPAEGERYGKVTQVNPADRRYGRSTLPFRNIYDVSMENIPPRIRDLQTKAIEEYIQGRLHSSLRLWIQSLTYVMKFELVQEVTDRWAARPSNVEFYARNVLEDIKNTIQNN